MQMFEKRFMQILRKSLLCYYCFFLFFFWWQKIAFKTSVDLYFHPSIIEFRMEEKIHIKAVADVSRDDGRRIFLGKIREEVSGNLLSRVKLCQRIWKWNLNQNLIMALLIVAVWTVLFWKLTRQEICSFFLRNVEHKDLQDFEIHQSSMLN